VIPATLVERLRGIVRVPVNDGAGLLDGKDFFERSFPTSNLAHEAADLITQLRAERDAAAREASTLRQVVYDMTEGISAAAAARDVDDAVNAAAREMRERCAGWHDAQATICRDVAKANQGNEVGPVFHALVVDHEVAADAIRALPDDSSVVATECITHAEKCRNE
jgi:hypothetical protein